MTEDLRIRFEQLDGWILAHLDLWMERPFTGLPVAWEPLYPSMARALGDLSEGQIDEAEQCGALSLKVPEPFLSLAQRASELVRCEPFSKGSGIPKRPRRIGERKWRQISSFVSALEGAVPDEVSLWLDWCSGKGHLGRTLGHATGRPSLCIERNPALCAQGGTESLKSKARVSFLQRDVLCWEPDLTDTGSMGALALHACGDLHARLIQYAVNETMPFIALAPCCYHRIEGDRYQPLSSIGKRSSLSLHRHHLRLISFDENVASSSGKAARRKEQLWRLAFDLLQREARGVDEYLPVGPVPMLWLRGTVGDFCRRLADRKGVRLLFPINEESLLQRASDRLRQVRGLGLIRGLFRRPLETWVVLDRALFLQESGYDVQVGEFCPVDVSPRNLMIRARR